MAKGYLKVVRAKFLHVVDETFYSIPTDDANCQYLVLLTFGALAMWCKLAIKGVQRRSADRLSNA